MMMAKFRGAPFLFTKFKIGNNKRTNIQTSYLWYNSEMRKLVNQPNHLLLQRERVWRASSEFMCVHTHKLYNILSSYSFIAYTFWSIISILLYPKLIPCDMIEIRESPHSTNKPLLRRCRQLDMCTSAALACMHACTHAQQEKINLNLSKYDYLYIHTDTDKPIVNGSVRVLFDRQTHAHAQRAYPCIQHAFQYNCVDFMCGTSQRWQCWLRRHWEDVSKIERVLAAPLLWVTCQPPSQTIIARTQLLSVWVVAETCR